MKAANDKADPKGVKLESNNVVVLEEVNAVDLVLLLEKEKNKIFNQRTKNAKKAIDRALKKSRRANTKAMREAIAAVVKEAKKGEKPGKSKVIILPLLLTETSTTSPSQNPYKQDSFLT